MNLEEIREKNSQRALTMLVASIIVAFNAIGLLFVVRRFVGAFSGELSGGAMFLTAVVSTAVMACLRMAWRKRFPLSLDGEEIEFSKSERLRDGLIGYGSSLSLVLIAIGCCYPGDYTSDWLIWLPLLIADQFWRQSFFDAGHPERGAVETKSNFENETAPNSFSANAKNLGTKTGKREQPLLPPTEEAEEIVQQLYRVRDELGQDVIYGTLRADFLAGQRTAVVHAGFCPPLSHLPEIEAETFLGPNARIKVVQALAHGTRMDVRLATPAARNCHVWIDMAATPTSRAKEIED